MSQLAENFLVGDEWSLRASPVLLLRATGPSLKWRCKDCRFRAAETPGFPQPRLPGEDPRSFPPDARGPPPRSVAGTAGGAWPVQGDFAPLCFVFLPQEPETGSFYQT